MHGRERQPLQDTLTAIRLGTPLESAAHALYPNGERHLRDRETLWKWWGVVQALGFHLASK